MIYIKVFIFIHLLALSSVSFGEEETTDGSITTLRSSSLRSSVTVAPIADINAIPPHHFIAVNPVNMRWMCIACCFIATGAIGGTIVLVLT